MDVATAFHLLLKKKEKREPDYEEIPLEEKKTVSSYMEELDQLIGLKKVKDLVFQLQALITIQRERSRIGLKNTPNVLHMVFKGNPGTGKTTVARILGQIFRGLGVLEKGDLQEVERADLVGEYIGQTAQKTRKIIKESLGGILFVDEAYSLARGGERDFGKEAIDTIVKAMEDYRENLIIILAGYRREMEVFLQTNPGLNSRFPIQLDFEDYSLAELLKIADSMLEEREYILDKTARASLSLVLTEKRMKEGGEGGNARTVRNIVEQTIRNQAVRLYQEQDYSKRSLLHIREEDLEGGDGPCPLH